MDRMIRFHLLSAIGAYILKFAVDAVMYMFISLAQNDLYNDLFYLALPQVISSVMMVAFYVLFLNDEFYTLFFRISTVVLIGVNLLFAVLMFYDRTTGYVFYFFMAALINFLNALYLKCNIFPERKEGDMEYTPMFFELLCFVCMIASLYSAFCSFPFWDAIGTWIYYDIEMSYKINIFIDFVMGFIYVLCIRNNSEYIYDNMLIDDIID